MEKFEYKVICTHILDTYHLSEFGANGWELAAVCDDPRPGRARMLMYHFKRKIK